METSVEHSSVMTNLEDAEALCVAQKSRCGGIMLPMRDSIPTFVKMYQQGTLAGKVETTHELPRCREVRPRDYPRWPFAG